MFTRILERIDFLRKLIINSFFIIFIIALIIGLFIFPFINNNKADIKGSILSLSTKDISDRSSSYFDSEENLTVYEIANAFEYASYDDDVEIVFLDLSYISISSASAFEVGKSIQLLRKKGKKVIAYGDFLTQSQYLLASYADEVILNPFGMVFLEGFKKYQIYLKDFLDNNNIVVNTFVAGDYKSATEIFSESKMSEQDRQQSKIFLNDLWKNWLKEVGNNRLSIDVDINFFINNFNELDPSLSAAEKAKKYGLVDKILTRIELRKYFYELANKDENNIIKEPKTVSLKSYYDGKKESNFSKDKIIVLNAYGEIIDGSFQDNQISSEFFSKKLNEISKDPSVKGLLLRINSPGGSGFASEVIRQELLNLKNSGVPIVVSISDIAASGGYWISANADEIWATPLSVTGSIGVFALLPTIENALSKFGFNYDGLSTTDFNPSIVANPSENLKSFIQNYVDRAYSDFINLVSEGRNLNIDSVNEISNGKIWTGTQALENGLIDNIGTQSEAIERLKEIIGYEEIDVEYLNFKQSFFDFLGNNLLNFQTLNNFFKSDLNIKNYIFNDFNLLEKEIINLRFDCLNCLIK
ncbi:MAG: signal peptide peptidase SppA [Gammaproteobacteria bacterium]